jgi:hypothetical protein
MKLIKISSYINSWERDIVISDDKSVFLFIFLLKIIPYNVHV